MRKLVRRTEMGRKSNSRHLDYLIFYYLLFMTTQSLAEIQESVLHQECKVTVSNGMELILALILAQPFLHLFMNSFERFLVPLSLCSFNTPCAQLYHLVDASLIHVLKYFARVLFLSIWKWWIYLLLEIVS